MANSASAKKSARKIVARTEINKSRRSRMRTFIRKVEEAIAGGKHDEAVAALKAAEPEIARSPQDEPPQCAREGSQGLIARSGDVTNARAP